MQKDNMEDGQTSREANKVCGVCGDKALGYNFNAVSCESCKAFFRRNAVKKKDFNCPFTENCNITTVTRRFCQKCRLDKCFSIGMRKEYIMSEEDKVLKRNKIEQNRAKKRPSPDNHKTPKTKKESVDDTSFDDTSTSLPSVASGTSGVSETCLWESDRIAELDVNKQLAVDNLSPITAASVPSPSSPPENYDIVGSKTLEMLKDATLSKNGFSIPYDLTEISGDKCSSSQINFNNEFKQDVRFLSEPTRISETIFTNNLSENAAQDPSNVSIIKQNETTYLYNNQTMETCINQAASLMLTQSNIEEEIVKQKSEESIAKESNKKPARNPELFAKLLQNPNILTKVFQNKNFLDKFFSDSNVISKLMSDPQISQILETNISLTGIDELKTLEKNGVEKNICDEQLKDINVSLNCNKNSLGSDQNQVQNPILTNLIINQGKDEQVKKSNNTGNLNEKSRGDVAKDILQDVQQIPIAANSIESILCEAIKLEYSAFSSLSTHSSRELNDAERAKLNELIVAHKALLAPLDEDISNLISDDCKLKANPGETDPMLLGVINLTAIAIRRLIKMAKKISAFKNMCQEDQLALLKGGCTEMMILRSAINYDPDKEIWKIPHSQYKMANIKVEVLKEAKGNLYDEHSKFVRTFDSRWRDENIILILSAIALFSPKRPRVIHTDVIKLEQNSYYYLLRRYLESVYPGCEAKSTFLKLIKKMSELQKLNEEVVGVYLNVNPSSVEPLLIEIFDLKH